MRKAVTQQPGVIAIQVRLDQKRATVYFHEGQTSVEQLVAVLDDTGYEAKQVG